MNIVGSAKELKSKGFSQKFIAQVEAGNFLAKDKNNTGSKVNPLQELSTSLFYKYLNDVIYLEMKMVNSACNKLIYDDLVVKYPESTKVSMSKILVDEYCHINIARQMKLDEHLPDFEELSHPVSDLYDAVMVIKSRLEPKYQDVFELLAVSIFETTLVSELMEFSESEHVNSAIKHYVKEHMHNKVESHGFYYDLLCYTWNNLPEDYQANIGSHLADFIKMYLRVYLEKSFYLQILTQVLHDEVKARQVIENVFKEFDEAPDKTILRNVMTILKESGIMDSNYVKNGFSRTLAINF